MEIPTSQLDLFIANASDISPKEQIDLMARCWFALDKRIRTESIIHRSGDDWVSVSAGKKGLASIFDNDVLLFVISHYMDAINRGVAPKELGRRFQFTAYEYFVFVGKKHIGGRDYVELWKKLQRLQGTVVNTNIRTDNQTTQHAFNWLSEIKQIKEGNHHRGFEVVVPSWIHDSVVNKKLVLTLNPGYFQLTSGLQRFLYLFGRKSSGRQITGWTESVVSLHRKSSSRSPIHKFRSNLKRAIQSGHILDYKVRPVDGDIRYGVKFSLDREAIGTDNQRDSRVLL